MVCFYDNPRILQHVKLLKKHGLLTDFGRGFGSIGTHLIYKKLYANKIKHINCQIQKRKSFSKENLRVTAQFEKCIKLTLKLFCILFLDQFWTLGDPTYKSFDIKPKKIIVKQTF